MAFEFDASRLSRQQVMWDAVIAWTYLAKYRAGMQVIRVLQIIGFI
jgi:hypothetical protein